jgi:hypothetical protein
MGASNRQKTTLLPETIEQLPKAKTLGSGTVGKASVLRITGETSRYVAGLFGISAVVVCATVILSPISKVASWLESPACSSLSDQSSEATSEPVHFKISDQEYAIPIEDTRIPLVENDNGQKSITAQQRCYYIEKSIKSSQIRAGFYFQNAINVGSSSGITGTESRKFVEVTVYPLSSGNNANMRGVVSSEVKLSSGQINSRDGNIKQEITKETESVNSEFTYRLGGVYDFFVSCPIGGFRICTGGVIDHRLNIYASLIFREVENEGLVALLDETRSTLDSWAK